MHPAPDPDKLLESCRGGSPHPVQAVGIFGDLRSACGAVGDRRRAPAGARRGGSPDPAQAGVLVGQKSETDGCSKSCAHGPFGAAVQRRTLYLGGSRATTGLGGGAGECLGFCRSGLHGLSHLHGSVPALIQMAGQLPSERQALPVLKVLYRNSSRIQNQGSKQQVRYTTSLRRSRPISYQMVCSCATRCVRSTGLVPNHSLQQ